MHFDSWWGPTVASERSLLRAGLGSAIAALAAMTALGCSSGTRRFPLREGLWQDSDVRNVSVACEARPSDKDPKHIACAPRPYVSPRAWDGIDNSIFRPLAKVWAVDPPREAPNVNAFDEVPDSAWFQNRLGIR